MLPNLIVIGAGKAGTTSLWAYLDRHPDVFMAPAKELDFFTTEHNWHRGQAWYESCFAGSEGAAVVGEVSGNYANWPEFDGVPGRMAAMVPDARLVYVIRHPVERMVSHHRYLWSRGEEDQPMEVAFRERPLYRNVSSYASQIDRYLEHFPAERLHVLTSEDLRDDRDATMAGVFAHLGLDAAAAGSFDHEYNLTESKRFQRRSALRWASRLPGYDALAERAPVRLRTVVRKVGKVEVLKEADGRLDDDLRRRLEVELGPETARLRHHLGSDFHCWGLA